MSKREKIGSIDEFVDAQKKLDTLKGIKKDIEDGGYNGTPISDVLDDVEINLVDVCRVERSFKNIKKQAKSLDEIAIFLGKQIPVIEEQLRLVEPSVIMKDAEVYKPQNEEFEWQEELEDTVDDYMRENGHDDCDTSWSDDAQ